VRIRTGARERRTWKLTAKGQESLKFTTNAEIKGEF